MILLFLTMCAALAAGSVVVRADMNGRAERLVLFGIVFYVLLGTPVFVLGYTHQLYRVSLGILSFAFSAAICGITARGRSFATHKDELLTLFIEFVQLPWEASRRTVQAASFAWLGVAFVGLTIVCSIVLTYLAPSESWDGYFYHEPIVGFALQNHGFQMVPLPMDMVVQGVNGYPRFCEAISLWFVIFTDKTWIEIGNTLAIPGLMGTMYVLGRRYCSDSVKLFGWCGALLMVPGVVTQVRTSMIDVQVGFFLLAGIHFATRPAIRLRDAAIALVCLMLVVGSKSSALTLVPPVAIVTYVRVLRQAEPSQRGRAYGVLAGGTLGIIGMGALTFLRNWLAFHNPVWPVTYDLDGLGIHWRGITSLAQIAPDISWPDLLWLKYHQPTPGTADIIGRDYGYGVPWVVVPLAIFGTFQAAVVVVHGRRVKSPDAVSENFLLLVLLGLVLGKCSPSIAVARYNIHLVAIAMLSVVWMAENAPGRTRLHEGALSAVLVMTLVGLFWTNWRYGVDGAYVKRLVRTSANERTTMHFETFHMPTEVAQAREREVGPGDLVVFTQDAKFPGVLWNHAMTNRVEFLEYRHPPALLADLARLRPRWVIVGERSEARRTLDAKRTEWEQVGTACQQDRTLAYRRK